jgi:hypothetical protein
MAANLGSQSTLTNPGLKRTLWEEDPPITVEIIAGQIILNTHTPTMAVVEIIVVSSKKPSFSQKLGF